MALKKMSQAAFHSPTLHRSSVTSLRGFNYKIMDYSYRNDNCYCTKIMKPVLKTNNDDRELNSTKTFSKAAALYGKNIVFPRGIGGYQVIRRLTCWNCGGEIRAKEDEVVSLVMCLECGSLLKLEGTDVPNYFELLGQPQSYRVDLAELSSKVRQLQRKLHPDLFGRKGKEEQELSQELSSLVNKAFSTLSDPIERGRYLLKLRGIEDPIGDAEKEMNSDPIFLEEVMELNERLVEISTEKDWMEFRKQNDSTLQDIRSQLEVAFESEKIDEAKVLLGRMKFFDTLQIKLQEVKSKLGIVE